MMIDENEWQKFRGAPLPAFDERVYVTLNRKSQIYMNRHTYHLLGAPPYVEMYLHRDGGSILIAAVPAATASSLAVREKQVGYVILASPFCRHHNLRAAHTIQFTHPALTDGTLKLNLTQTVPTQIGLRRQP